MIPSVPLQKLREIAHSLIAVLGVLLVLQAPVTAALHQSFGAAYDAQTSAAFAGIGAASALVSKVIDSRFYVALSGHNAWQTVQRIFADAAQPLVPPAPPLTPPSVSTPVPPAADPLTPGSGAIPTPPNATAGGIGFRP